MENQDKEELDDEAWHVMVVVEGEANELPCYLEAHGCRCQQDVRQV